MQSYITMFVLLIILAVTAQAKAPIRIAFATHSPSASGMLNIDVLSSSGCELGITLTKSLTTNDSGFLSIVLDETDLLGILPCSNFGTGVQITEQKISLGVNISTTEFPGG